MEENQQLERKSNAGRPEKVDEFTIQKLEYAFSIGASVRQACFYANICPQTYYNKVNKDPELLERFEALKENPVLQAKQTIFNNLEDPNVARWLLERRAKDEFGNAVDITSQGRHIADNAITFKEFNKDGTNSEQSV